MNATRKVLKYLGGELLLRSGAYPTLFGDRGVIVAFHRIDDRYPHNAISLGRGRFVSFCRFFREHFDVVPLSRIVDNLSLGSSVARQLAITFDDGYLDNFTTAAPCLAELGLPATFFITTGFIGSRAVPWWDQSSSIESEWMTWDHVGELHRMGFEIGAHTVSHADLGNVQGVEAREEILGSKLELEDHLGVTPDLFAYPYGGIQHLTEDNRALVEELGFRCAISCFGGRVIPGESPFRLRRTPISSWFESPAQFALEILRE